MTWQEVDFYEVPMWLVARRLRELNGGLVVETPCHERTCAYLIIPSGWDGRERVYVVFARVEGPVEAGDKRMLFEQGGVRWAFFFATARLDRVLSSIFDSEDPNRVVRVKLLEYVI